MVQVSSSQCASLQGKVKTVDLVNAEAQTAKHLHGTNRCTQFQVTKGRRGSRVAKGGREESHKKRKHAQTRFTQAQ